MDFWQFEKSDGGMKIPTKKSVQSFLWCGLLSGKSPCNRASAQYAENSPEQNRAAPSGKGGHNAGQDAGASGAQIGKEIEQSGDSGRFPARRKPQRDKGEQQGIDA